MQSQIQAIGLSWLVLLVTLIAILNVLEIRLRAQDYKPFNTASALAYITQHADREEKIRIPMRDGVRLSALILFPKNFPRQNLPTVLFRSPYLIEPGEVGRFAQYLQSFLENGYAAIFENVRGRYFSEGTYTYLVGSGKDGYDTVDWITKQQWSNGKVGTLGCSSTAEEQHKLNGAQPPGLAATVPMASGAGIGRVGPYNEMGNFYRGGAFQNWWFSWYYKAGYTYRPLFPPNLSREALIRLGRFWNLEPETVPASNIDTLIWTLPINQIMDKMGAPPSDLDDFVNRLPNDPKWKNVDFAGEGDLFGAPMLMINSWYDLSIGPNIALFEYESKNAANETARNNMFMVIAPTTHCQQGYVESEHTIVGQRDMGDARFDYVRLVQQWFDHFLKGDENGVTNQPKVRAYMMGANIDSDGSANSLAGNGRLTTSMPEKPGTDSFVYDPMYPVPSQGGNMATLSPSFQNGSVDQSNIEMRNDVLVYSTAPLKESVEIAGPVKVSMYLSSDAKDTDLTIKLIDVYPDGKAYNLDESVQRVRWRNGWEKPVFMQPGVVYKVDVGPLVTSNAFRPGHRIRIEVSSSNFPHFERNLNTGGNNFDEKQGVLAHNVIYHSPTYPSMVVLPLLPAGNRHYPATTE